MRDVEGKLKRKPVQKLLNISLPSLVPHFGLPLQGGVRYEFITNLPSEITSKVRIFNCLNHPFKIFYNNFPELFSVDNTKVSTTFNEAKLPCN